MQDLFFFTLVGSLIAVGLALFGTRQRQQPLKIRRLLGFWLIMLVVSYGWIALFYLANAMLPDALLWLAWIVPTIIWFLLTWLVYHFMFVVRGEINKIDA